MAIRWLVLVLISVVFPVFSFSQSQVDPELWNNIETAIEYKRNLSATYSRLEDIKARAQKNKDHIAYARARYYQLIITDARTEDSLYFRNSAFIDSTLQQPGVPPALQGIMHMLQARRLARNIPAHQRPRYETRDLRYNYAAFTETMLDSTIEYHYEQVKKLLPAFKIEDPEDLTWLSSNPLVFLFKPAMYDIIQAEQIAYKTAVTWFHQSWKKQFSDWLKLSPADFIKALDTVQSKSREAVILRLFNDWLGSHTKDTAAFYFIESFARKYMYEQVRYDRTSEAVYEKYLLSGTESPIREVRANAVYQLCLLWNSRARDEFRAEKFPPAKALRLYESNSSLFDDFAYLGRILEAMKEQILESSISWKMDGNVLPREPLLARIEYKNTASLYYRIISLGQEEQLPEDQDTAIRYLLNKPYLRSITETLPVTDDLDKHRTFLKIDPLPAGRYTILFAAKEIAGYDDDIDMLPVKVSQIAIVASDNRIYVLNRKTGLPLEGAQVSVTYKFSEETSGSLLNRNGYVPVKKKEKYSVRAIKDADTLTENVNTIADDLANELYDKDKEEDLLEYYIDHARMQMFTDRSIYRPGQIVFYKGILMTKDPYTGATIIVNKKNLQQGLFRDLLKKWLSEEEPDLYISDPFRRKVTTISVKPDAFGAISGSFRIPATAATGRWDFDGDIEEASWHSGSFRVEEYKRPTFELTAEPPSRSYLPGDTVTFKLKVRSFAGSTMANTKIFYTIKRNAPYYMPEGPVRAMDIDSVVLTGENGIAEIIIADTALRNNPLPDSLKCDFHYTLMATATDVSGESHDIENTLHVSSRPVVINFPLKGSYYVNDLRPVLVTAKDLNKVELSRNIKVKVFRVRNGGANVLSGLTNYADQWKYPETQLAQWFPHVVFRYDKKLDQELVYETTINTGAGEKIRIPAGILTTGHYTVQAACYDNNILRGEEKSAFIIYDTVSAHLPGAEHAFFHCPVNYINPGDSVRLYTGSAFDSTYLLLQVKYYSQRKKKLVIVPVFREQLIKAGVHSFTFQVPDDVTDHAIITSCFIKNNEICRHTERILINQQSTQAAIIIEQFRSKLTPGQQTTFTVSVKTKDQHVAAELMSTLYDASLDKLEKHNWEVPRLRTLDMLRNNWPRSLSSEVFGTTYFNQHIMRAPVIRHPLWWMRKTWQRPTASYWELEGEADYDRVFTKVEGQVAGISISQTTGINQVVVIGYGTSKKSLSTGSAVSIRGSNSLTGDWNNMLVLLDGVPYTGKLNELNTAEVTDMMVLKDAAATAIYGSRAANGVILISTKGPVKIPELKEEPIVKVRNNFNELAFFYPAVHADKDGYYRFTFTVPESLTEWNWKLFAHTKNAQFAYAERKLTTQLPFMITPNMPKALYQGDQLILKSRISNLDSLRKTGKTVCKAEDAVTGEDITAAVVKNTENQFEMAGNSNTVTGTVLNIPAAQLNPIKITIKAMAGDFADGEEHIIPILTDKVLVKEAVAFRMAAHADTLVTLPARNEVYGLGLSIPAKPQAALINSLPFLANYSFDCAEQTFNKMLANIIAVDIMRSDKNAQQAYATARQTTEKNQTPPLLPDQLSEQAMPWLQLTSRTALQQTQLFQLLDTVRTKRIIQTQLDKLYALQNKDGGVSWFKGGESNPYISAYVLAGFGKLYAQSGGLALLKEQRTQNFIAQLVQYVDGHLTDLFALYARGLWNRVTAQGPGTVDHRLTNRVMVPNRGTVDTQHAQVENTLKQQWEGVEKGSLYQQALLIITSMQWLDQTNALYAKALQQLEHVRQQAIEDPVNGIRWKAFADADDLTVSTEETLALLSEAFDSSSNATQVNEGIIKWLLVARPEHEWKTTKGAAAAIGLLKKTTNPITDVPNTLSVTIANKALAVTDDLLAGQPFSFIKTNNIPATLAIKRSANQPVSGNIMTYYFAPASQLSQLNTAIKLTKDIFRFNHVSNSWERVGDSSLLKVSDKIKVVLTIETTRNLPYVYIDDKTGGAFESMDVHSGYEYAHGIHYYKSVRDAGMQFFADLITAGRTQISYELQVAQEGRFTNGPAVLQCMYKPEKTAYSNSVSIKTAE